MRLKAICVSVSRLTTLKCQSRYTRLDLRGRYCLSRSLLVGHQLIRDLSFFVAFRILRIRVGDHNHLPENLIELISAILLVPPPLDEDVEADRLDNLTGSVPAKLFDKSVIPGMRMTNVGENRGLNTPVKR